MSAQRIDCASRRSRWRRTWLIRRSRRRIPYQLRIVVCCFAIIDTWEARLVIYHYSSSALHASRLGSPLHDALLLVPNRKRKPDVPSLSLLLGLPVAAPHCSNGLSNVGLKSFGPSLTRICGTAMPSPIACNLYHAALMCVWLAFADADSCQTNQRRIGGGRVTLRRRALRALGW